VTALVVVAHPDPESRTHHVAHLVADALEQAGTDTARADLHAEGFDPRFTLADRRRYQAAGPVPPDVAAEHERLDAVDDLVLVFPVFWWSMPAMLKGWVDRVFINGWAFDDRTTPMTRRLGRLTIHLVMLAGEDAEAFARRGYDTALTTQIVTGVLGYCGARTGSTVVLHESEDRSPASVEREARAAAAAIADQARRPVVTPG
jgi:NAD(P)H dehydrogenase (quinone)